MKLQHSVCVCVCVCALAPPVGAVRVSAHQQRHMDALIGSAYSEDNLNQEEYNISIQTL